jgi:hypothetical protein
VRTSFFYVFVIIIALFLPGRSLGQNPYNSICGNIASGQLTIPSYKFIVVDKNGHPFENLRFSGELIVTEGIWRSSWMDGYWETVYHNVPIPITYDPVAGVYVSQEMPNVTIAQRKKGSMFHKENCWDKIHRLTFTFDLGEEFGPKSSGYRATFNFNFENNPELSSVSLPVSKDPIKLTFHNWDGTKTPD